MLGEYGRSVSQGDEGPCRGPIGDGLEAGRPAKRLGKEGPVHKSRFVSPFNRGMGWGWPQNQQGEGARPSGPSPVLPLVILGGLGGHKRSLELSTAFITGLLALGRRCLHGGRKIKFLRPKKPWASRCQLPTEPEVPMESSVNPTILTWKWVPGACLSSGVHQQGCRPGPPATRLNRQGALTKNRFPAQPPAVTSDL
jgi:hypothetical protein